MAYEQHRSRLLLVVAHACDGLKIATSPARESKCVMRRHRITTASARRARDLSNPPSRGLTSPAGSFLSA